MTRLAVALAAGTVLALAASHAAVAADEGPWPEAIEDNSFLIEEAYNQDPGVVQWIVNVQYLESGHVWQESLTNEIPVGSRTHQLSYTLPFVSAGHDVDASLGDVVLNYRWQALDGGERGWWVAPRASLILPTGDWRGGNGEGATGFQVGLPLSRRLSRWFALHLNASGQFVPGTRGTTAGGHDFRADTWLAGGATSLVWLATTHVNFMLEAVGAVGSEAVGDHRTRGTDLALASPSVRYALDFKAGQLVLGAAAPIGLTANSPDVSAFLYLSWEAPVWMP